MPKVKTICEVPEITALPEHRTILVESQGAYEDTILLRIAHLQVRVSGPNLITAIRKCYET